MNRCYCDECRKLDRMRYQGIPGTFQIGLLGERRHEHLAPPPPPAPLAIAGVAGLPLFDGELEPVLF